MAETYRLTFGRRVLNVLIRPLVRLGLGGRHTYLLSVPGRRSGRRYSTPVTLVEHGDERWLVAPYGERSWVKNARAAGWIELSRAGRRARLAIDELGPEESAPILREYVRNVPVTRPFFEAGPESPDDDFATEAPRHPVFRLRPAGSGEGKGEE